MTASFPALRLRRTRTSAWSRALHRETRISPADLIWPIFVTDGQGVEDPVASLPGVSRWSVDGIAARAKEAVALGIPCMALFPHTQPERRSEDGREALNPDNLMCRALRAVKERNAETAIPFMDMMRRYPGNVLKGMGARYIDGVFFNIFGVFSITYLTTTIKISRSEALIGVMVAAIVMCFAIPFFGRLSDKVGRARMYMWGSLITGIVSFPAFWLMSTSNGNMMMIWLATIIPFGILYAMVYAPEAALFCDLFDAKVRYTGISFVYQFSGIFASGITPMIATALLAANDNDPHWLAMYVAFAGIVSMISAILLHRRRHSHHHG